MKALIPYLMFAGNCREALEYYRPCFGGELQIMTFAEAPEGNPCATGKPDQIMHGMLVSGELNLMASDSPMSAPVMGDNVHLHVTCDSLDHLENVFGSLAANGRVTLPLQDAFWGSRFGMLTDRFGIHWMLSTPLAQ